MWMQVDNLLHELQVSGLAGLQQLIFWNDQNYSAVGRKQEICYELTLTPSIPIMIPTSISIIWKLHQYQCHQPSVPRPVSSQQAQSKAGLPWTPARKIILASWKLDHKAHITSQTWRDTMVGSTPNVSRIRQAWQNKEIKWDFSRRWKNYLNISLSACPV